jgi:hypothetical protein
MIEKQASSPSTNYNMYLRTAKPSTSQYTVQREETEQEIYFRFP